MRSATVELIALALVHLNEIPDSARRADMLDAAGRVLADEGESRGAQQARTTAAILREADAAQLRLTEEFQQVLS